MPLLACAFRVQATAPICINMQNKYRIASGYNTTIYQGDLVAVVTGGGIERVAAGGSGLILGVFNGCQLH